ncbi:MAG TPA: hypothetical protein VNK67_12105 [Burkholderiales bacterium]|nr:hypothetical protein [Burkholderiales bacterium]
MIQLTQNPLPYASHDDTWMVHVFAGRYDNDRIALVLLNAEDHDELIAVASVNLPAAPCGPHQVFVKDWSENEGITEWLVAHNIIQPEPQRAVRTGFVVARAYDLTAECAGKLARGT